MTIEEAIELGRAWPDWTWAQGQIYIGVRKSDGFVSPSVGVVVGLPDSDWWANGPTNEMWEAIPDFRDYGTLGHAVAQVTDAWRDCCWDISEDYTGASFDVLDGPQLIEVGDGALARVLLAARKAAKEEHARDRRNWIESISDKRIKCYENRDDSWSVSEDQVRVGGAYASRAVAELAPTVDVDGLAALWRSKRPESITLAELKAIGCASGAAP